MDTDRVLGAGILIGCIVVAILYFGSIFFDYWKFITSVKAVVSIGLVVLLGIGGWIGWTMLTTPTPEPVEDIDLEEDIEEEAEEEVNETEEKNSE